MPALARGSCQARKCAACWSCLQPSTVRRLVQSRRNCLVSCIKTLQNSPELVLRRHRPSRKLFVQAQTAELQDENTGSLSVDRQPVTLLWLAVSVGFAVTRWSPQWQGCVLLLLEGLYASLHLYPLLHLVNVIGSGAAERFMHALTRAQYFGTELWLLAMLTCCTALRRAVGTPVLAVHLAFHVLYFSLALLAPRWCIQQNVKRIQASSESSRTLVEATWHVLLNLLNSMDAALHIVYAWSLLRLTVTGRRLSWNGL